MLTMTYPGSRISSSGQCKMCRGVIGNFENNGLILLQNADGTELKLLRWTCNYCGFTMLFDPAVPANSPYKGEGKEELPEFLS